MTLECGARETKSLSSHKDFQERESGQQSDATERSSKRMELCMWSVATKRPLVSDS